MFADNFYCASCGARHDFYLTRCRVCKADSVCRDGRGDERRAQEALQQRRQEQRKQERQQRELQQAQAKRRDEDAKRVKAQAKAQADAQQAAARSRADRSTPTKPSGSFNGRAAFLFFLIGTAWAASQPDMDGGAAMVVGAIAGVIVGKYFKQLLTLAVVAAGLYLVANA